MDTARNLIEDVIINKLGLVAGLPNLANHYLVILLSTVACFTIQSFSHSFLSPKLFPKYYPLLSSYTKFNWDIRLVAWVHAFYATSIAAYVLFNPVKFKNIHQDKLFGYQHDAMNYLSISTGYFLWDIIVSLKLSFNRAGVGFLLHAVSCFVAFLYSIKPFCGYFGFAFLLWEASTIFLNPHWFFDKVGMSGSKTQLYNGIVLLLTFFFSRLVFGNYTSYQLFVLSFEHGVSQKAGPRLLNTIRILDMLLTGLNVYWFYQMISSVMKRFSSKKSSYNSNLDRKNK